jgi:hypothetical protein
MARTSRSAAQRHSSRQSRRLASLLADNDASDPSTGAENIVNPGALDVPDPARFEVSKPWVYPDEIGRAVEHAVGRSGGRIYHRQYELDEDVADRASACLARLGGDQRAGDADREESLIGRGPAFSATKSHHLVCSYSSSLRSLQEVRIFQTRAPKKARSSGVRPVIGSNASRMSRSTTPASPGVSGKAAAPVGWTGSGPRARRPGDRAHGFMAQALAARLDGLRASRQASRRPGDGLRASIGRA